MIDEITQNNLQIADRLCCLICRCISDVVTVYEGPLINRTNALGKFCGNLSDSLPIISSKTNKLTVVFTSNARNNHEGFDANVSENEHKIY